jgi:hypothetical protein
MLISEVCLLERRKEKEDLESSVYRIGTPIEYSNLQGLHFNLRLRLEAYSVFLVKIYLKFTRLFIE